ncbi:uncharacterized protein LOC119980430 isoform X1 [Tripterygium wilfordii]|uniref:uncharacterized protein LOC119980430 isoform X1 n=1 Tax=Tripterygium wilfordii TaxID=458696 RepID=UPI0018F81FFE|nr:uncharacterized protein LOC119980430 isoform X1 [Tripterygium wilfordii]
MEDISNSANANPNSELSNKPSKSSREEGELSSSEDDENLVYRPAECTGAITPITVPVEGSLLNKLTESNQAGRTISGNNNPSSVEVQCQTNKEQISYKSLETTRAPLKSSNSGWYAPSVDNNNLVISFSDNDSGSDFEDNRQEEAVEIKSNNTGLNIGWTPPTSSLSKPNNLQQTLRNKKVIPKKSSVSRLMTKSKINGGANSRVSGPPIVEQGSRVGNYKTLNKNLASQDSGSNQGVGLNNGKLEDLRQRIALRESEMKLKAAVQNKEPVSVSCGDFNAMKQSTDAARKSAAVSADVALSEPKEPDLKRLKVSGSDSTMHNADRRQQKVPAKSNFNFKEQEPENSNLRNRKGQEGTPLSGMESNIVKRQRKDDKGVTVSSANRRVHDINSNHQSGNVRQEDPPVVKSRVTMLTNMASSTFPNSYNGKKLNHPTNCAGNHPPTSFVAAAAAGSDQKLRSSQLCRVVSEGQSLQPPLNSVLCTQESLKNESLSKYLGNGSFAAPSNYDIQSLDEMEELLDKELEEAQEHRHKCEIEERTALKAYRKAQRALIEANAKCKDLYHRREIYAARFQSLIMNDSGLLLTSRQNEHVGRGLDFSNGMSKGMELIPTGSDRMQTECDGFNQMGYDLNVPYVNGGPVNVSYGHVNEQNLGSEPCSEPDISTSEPLRRNDWVATYGVRSLSSDPNISGDEDEGTSQLNHESLQSSFKSQQKVPDSMGQQKDKNHESNIDFSNDSSPDLLLETKLRSELFARLQMRASGNNCGLHNSIDIVDDQAADDVSGEKNQMSNSNLSLMEAVKNLKGLDGPERSISEVPVHIHSQSYVGECLRSTFSHVQVVAPFSLLGLQSRNQQSQRYDYYTEDVACVSTHDIQKLHLVPNSIEASFADILQKEIDSYTCNITVNPFWPFCMYELRGKCNNDECPWQHCKEFSNGDTCQRKHDDSCRADCQDGLTSQKDELNVARGLSKFRNVLTLPTYLVSLDSLKVNPHLSQSVVSWRIGECWLKCFSIYLALSNSLQKDFSANECLVFGSNGRVEIHGTWNRQSSYFQSRNGVVHDLANNAQSLETALLFLSQEVNKIEGLKKVTLLKKALTVLSRTLEADPKSEIIWIVYLLILYSNKKLVGKDDMFSYAVKHNEGSYVLWLMYINSRGQLDERLSAFSNALLALCRNAYMLDGDGVCASAYILDLFLQMIECFCVSENVDMAIQKIYGLLSQATHSDEPLSLVSDILKCLTISDKCVFWICCVYLVIYRKLPDAVVQRFESQKELLGIEWPSVYILGDEKQRIMNLVEIAVDSVESSMNAESFNSEISLKSAHQFAINHIWCMEALGSRECARNLLDKYIKLYPSCLELSLMSARCHKHHSGALNFEGFEKVLNDWPKEVPGIQCIWNQYAEHALQHGRPDFIKELMVRWFNSVWKARHRQNETVGAMDSNSHCSPKSAWASNPDFSVPNLNHLDEMFGYLNLSLHKLLQEATSDVRLAMDSALKAADPDNFRHCVREHAIFLLTDELQLKEDLSICELLKYLKIYWDVARDLPVSEPLSRKFIKNIEKPRVQKLINDMLSPVSSEHSIVNVVLEAWYGPSLVPQNLLKPKELADFVESVLEMVPSNYPLAFAVCRLLSRDYNPADTASASVLFWASSILVNTIFNAVPIAPEYAWVEAAGILAKITGIEPVSERFYERALSVYPFSIKLWKCYYNLSKNWERTDAIVEAARAKGIGLL